MSLPEGHRGSDQAVLTVHAESVQPDHQETPAGLGGKRRILEVLLQLGLMRIAVSLSGLVRNKVMAVYLKPDGFGEFTQLVNIVEVVNVFVQFGMLVSLNRNTAAASGQAGRQRQLETANFVTISLAVGSLSLILPLLLSSAGNTVLMNLGVYPGFRQKMVLLALFLIAPIEALRVNYISFLSGLVDIKGISSKRSLAVIASTAIAVPLIAVFGITGACMQTAIASLFLAVLLGSRCKQQGYKPLALSWHKDAAKTLAYLGIASLLSGFALNATDTVIRAYLILHWGVAENGFYQAAMSLSGQVTAVILTSVGTYAVGTLCQTRDPKTLTVRIEELLRVVLPVATISLGAVGLFSRPLFSLLFSTQFHEGARFLPLLLASNYVQAAAWVVGAPLLGCGLVRTWTIIQLVGAAIRYVAVDFLSPALGPYSVPAGLFAAMLFDLLVNIAFCRRPIGVYLRRRTMVAMIFGGVAVTTAASAGAFGADWMTCLASVALLCCVTVAMLWSETTAAFKRVMLQYRLV
jgi:O-antigen/teichoic acid export membrane protein